MADVVLSAMQTLSNGSVSETNPPTTINSGDAVNKGFPTISNLARGITANTGIAFTNTNATHICDPSLLTKFNVLNAKSSLKQLLQQARDAIMSLFSGDALSPIITQLKQMAAWVTAKIKSLSKVIKAIAEVAAVAALIAVELPKIIAWIQNLPTAIIAIMAGCLASFTGLLSTATGIVSGAITSTTVDLNKALGSLKNTSINQNFTKQAAALAGSAPNIPTSFKPFV
jgi:hypothetical protein